MNRVLGVIPARYGSTRFPGKPLALIGSDPMVVWVCRAVAKANLVERLVVATDDERIRDAVEKAGFQAIMTSPDHATGTDRLVEVADAFPDFEVLINIQGDEPGIEPELINGVVRLKLDHPEWAATTAARPFESPEEALSPDRVKVVISRESKALYFSRSLIPFPRNRNEMPIYLHLGIYAYNRDFLMNFSNLPPSSLEKTESLEQLRILENDFNMGVYVTKESLFGVDTPDDIKQMTAIFKERGHIK